MQEKGLERERKNGKVTMVGGPFLAREREEEERGADFTNVVFPLIPLLPLNVYACIVRRGSEERMIRQIFRENGGGEEGGKRASPLKFVRLASFRNHFHFSLRLLFSSLSAWFNEPKSGPREMQKGRGKYFSFFLFFLRPYQRNDGWEDKEGEKGFLFGFYL